MREREKEWVFFILNNGLPDEALLAEFDTSGHQLDVLALFQGVHDHLLVFFRGHRASRVHNVASCLGLGVHRVDGGKNELLLELREH